MTTRLENLDGLRGLAILLVLVYHAFFRWQEQMPYGDRFSNFPFFEFGWLGVNLFFLISGFVITMSLDNCEDIKTFIFNRWLRLLPAMAVVSLFILLTARFITERPAGQPQLSDSLPGLLFIEPYLLEKLIGHSFRSLEGAFWSIYVEVKFYIFSAVVYFIAGRRMLFFSLLSCFTIAVLFELTEDLPFLKPLDLLRSFAHYASFIYFGWFAAGAAIYLHFYDKQRRYLVWAFLSSVFASVFQGLGSQVIIAYSLLTCVVFALAVYHAKTASLLKNKVLLWLGFISYPLYLIHENMMVGLTLKFADLVPSASGLLALLLSVAIVLIVAYLVAKYAEPSLRELLKRALS